VGLIGLAQSYGKFADFQGIVPQQYITALAMLSKSFSGGKALPPTLAFKTIDLIWESWDDKGVPMQLSP